MTGTDSSNKDTFFSMSTHMWQSNQILRSATAFLFFFLAFFFLYVQLNVMTVSAAPQDKSSVVRSAKEEKLQ